MPCRSYEDDCPVYVENPINNVTKDKLDTVTRLFCETLTQFQKFSNLKEHLSPEAFAWWEEHQEEDKRRIAAEKLAEERAASKQRAKELKEKQGRRKIYLQLKKEFDD